MLVFLLATILIGLGFAGIAIKIWAKEGGEFAGTCASNSPFLNEEGKACAYCGAAPNEKCRKDDIGSSPADDKGFSPFVA